MKIVAMATGPAVHRNVGKDNKSVYSIEVLDSDGGTLEVSAWGDTNPWPDAKMGTRIDATINRVTMYKSKVQATLVTASTGQPGSTSTPTPPKA